MANSIDLGTIAIGAALGYGLRREIKDAGTIAKVGLLAGLGVTAAAVAAAVDEGSEKKAANAAAQANNQGGKNDH